jgi:hypothetical protein
MTLAKKANLIAAILAAGLGTTEVQACVACFGQSDSAMAQGMNMGIFTLLLVITCVLCTIAGFFVYLIRRASQVQTPEPLTFSENRINA